MWQALCLSTILASSLHQNSSLNPLVQIWGSMKCGVRSLAICCLLQWIWCYPVFSGEIGVYESLIFGNTSWKLHRRGVCIGGWQCQNSASGRTPNSSEPQICTSWFSTVIWLMLDAKIVDKHKAWQSCWLGTPDRHLVRPWEGEILDWLFLLFCMKRSFVCDRLRFCAHHLVVYQYYSTRSSMRGPTTLISCMLNAPK